METLKKLAEQLASQTGTQLNIIIFNPDNNKTKPFHTQNMIKEPWETSKPNLHIQLNQPSKQLPVTHSPSKGLTLPNNKPSVEFHSYNQSPMTSLPGGAASTLLPSPKIRALSSASSKKSTTKCKLILSQKIALPKNMPSADFHNYNQLPMMSLSGSEASTPLPTPKIQALLSASSKKSTTKCKLANTTKEKIQKIAGESKVRPERNWNNQICGQCDICFDSPRDKVVLKDPDFQWIGCDFKYYKFWGHAKCLSVVIGDKNIKRIEFYCLEHKKKNDMMYSLC